MIKWVFVVFSIPWLFLLKNRLLYNVDITRIYNNKTFPELIQFNRKSLSLHLFRGNLLSDMVYKLPLHFISPDVFIFHSS